MINDHIVEYLEYYIELPESPGYAVMINGAWGVGKTFRVKQFIDSRKKCGNKIYYVSLYGAKSTEDLDQRLLVALAPMLANPLAQISGRIGGAILKRAGLDKIIEAGDLKSVGKPDLMIFDDLERADITAIGSLGYINQFVEQDGRKVVIIANEEEINDLDYKKHREKVIGETFLMREDIFSALDAFIDSMPTEFARKYVDKYKTNFLSIFEQSQSKNLRVLKQALWTWDRLYAAIDADMRAHSAGVLTLFELFAALCIEVRSGRLSRGDLQNRMDSIVVGHMQGSKENPPPLSIVSDKFPELRLHDNILSDDVLVQLLCEGVVDKTAINECLRSSSHFMKPEDEPAWKKVWYGIERVETEFENAFATMEEQFLERVFIEQGEILHVFGLRLFASEIGHLDLTPADVVAQCKIYVDDIVCDNRILSGEQDREHFRLNGAYGLCFNCADTDDFKELSNYYFNQLDCLKEKQWPDQAQSLLDLMLVDTSAFFAKICWTNDTRDSSFVDVPIFSAVSPIEFSDRLLDLHPAQFRTVLTAFKGRFEGHRLERQLTPEKAWIRSVHDILLERAKTMAPIRRFAIRNEVGRLIRPFVKA